MKSVGILVVLAAIVPACALAYDAETAPSPIGVMPIQLQGDEAFDLGAGLGVGWMRVPVEWRFFEPEDDDFNFNAGQEAWLQAMEARGINMTPVIRIGQDTDLVDFWATGHYPQRPDASVPPLDLLDTFDPTYGYSESYYDYIYTFVDHYSGRIDRITIENEINTDEFWYTGDSPTNTALKYIRILTTARMASNDADPDILVLDSGMGSGSWGAPIAKDRYDAGDWTWQEARDFLQAYYDRDAFVRRDLPQIWSISSVGQLQSFFNEVEVQFNYDRVVTVLQNLYSADLGMLLVDELNFKYTGDPWLLNEIVAWIDETIDMSDQVLDGVPAIPRKINNEASNWCMDGEYDPRACDTSPEDAPLLASELMKKIIAGLGLGIYQSIWYPLSNEYVLQGTARLGPYDEDGMATDMATACSLLTRFTGWRHQFERVDTLAAGAVADHVFSDRDTETEDVHVLWWDDGTHGDGNATVTLTVPDEATAVWHYTQLGDSTQLALTRGEVEFTVTQDPAIVWYKDVADPVNDDWDIDPLEGPPPIALLLANPAPNPAPGRVAIRFGLPETSSRVSLELFDVAGRRVAHLFRGGLDAGTFRVDWDGRDSGGRRVRGGIYLVRLQAGRDQQVKKIILAE